MRKIIYSVSLLLACSLCLRAQEQSASSGVAMGFSSIPRDVKTMGIGGQDAVRNISARTFEQEKFSVDASYMMWAPKGTTATNDIITNLYGKIADKVGLMASFSLDNGKEYATYDDNGAQNGSFKPNDMLITGGVSYKFTKFMSIGAGVRYATSKLTANDKLSSVGADVFLTWGGDNFVLTAGATNLGAKVKAADGTEFKAPTAATLAGYYDFKLGPKHAIMASAQMDYFFVGGFRAAVGARYAFNDMLFVRGGYNYGGKSILPSYASAGLGFKIKGFNVDAAVLFGSGDVNTTFQIGIGYSF